jgi:uncharacterized protein YcnI
MAGVVKKVLGGAAAVAMAVGLWSSPASAHVTINTLGTVTKGSFAKIGFSVPNERDDAGTVEVSVQLPADHPLAYVSVQPMPGWDITTTTRTLTEPLDGEGGSIIDVVDTITWTATGDTQIAPGQFELFWISAGQMPTDVDVLSFPAIQTYSSGEEVAWIDTATPGGAEVEHPAPTVQLADAADESATETSMVSASSASSGDSGTDGLTIVALVVGALGLFAGGAALVTARRPRPSTT